MEESHAENNLYTNIINTELASERHEKRRAVQEKPERVLVEQEKPDRVSVDQEKPDRVSVDQEKPDRVNPFMAQALICARKAPQTGDVPVGAVLVHAGQIVGTGWNCREADNRVVGHAEIMAIEEANRTLQSWRLDDCDLYVTLEPCSMCASAIMQARIRAVYFGAWDPKAGAAGSVMNLFTAEWANHHVTVYEGIMEASCKALLDSFFLEIRQERHAP